MWWEHDQSAASTLPKNTHTNKNAARKAISHCDWRTMDSGKIQPGG